MTDNSSGVTPIEPLPDVPPVPYVEDGARPDPYATPVYAPAGYQGAAYPNGANPYAPTGPRRSPILGILSVVLGGLGFFGAWIAIIPIVGSILGIPFPLAAVILGFVSKKKEPAAKGLWLTGIILGFVGLAAALLGLVLWILFFAASSAGYGSSYYDY